ncbi:MAG: Uma2 family endonuclease [Chloroflexota bacterium]|nr:Uma2 family endonuclease [Chloroflexota bacterium]
MVIHTPEGIDLDFSTFPESDGQPMAETRDNVIQMIDLVWELQALFSLQGRGPVTVGGNQFVYYNPANGRDNISPDVYVIFGVAVAAPAKWRTWVDGPFPHVVFEITSPSTEAHDLSEGLGGKRRLYAELGAQEYYVYDPQQEMDPPFRGFALSEGRMEPLPYTPLGGIESPLLETELRPMPIPRLVIPHVELRPAGVWLRVIDPRTGEPIPIPEEERVALLATQERLDSTQERLDSTQERLDSTQERLATEEVVRLAAEERAMSAETELRLLRDALARRQDADSTA